MWVKSFFSQEVETKATVSKKDPTEEKLKKNRAFFKRNEDAFNSYSIIKQLEIEMLSARADRLGIKQKRMSFNLHGSKIKEIYNIGIEYLPMSEPFWTNLLGFLLSEMERFDFSSQPSVNINDNDDMLYRRSGWSRSVKEVEINNILSKVNLLDHIYHTIIAFDGYCTESEGINMGREERVELFFACLLHDFGKSLKMSRHYGFVNNVKEILIYKHQAISARLFERVLEVHFEEDRERYFKFAMIESIADAVKQHHDSHPESITASHLRVCDQMARKYEMSEHERNKFEKH
jgi:predicted transposase YbfD/YdcC